MVKIKTPLITSMIFILLWTNQSQGRVVKNIVIEETGRHDEGRKDLNEEKECRSFKPNKKKIFIFFNRAKESSESGELVHKFYSPCLATGLVDFTDGSSGNWVLLSSGFGYVTFKDKLTTYFFNKDNKWNDPFACTYGLGDEPKC